MTYTSVTHESYKGQIYSTDFVGPRDLLERSAALRGLLPDVGRRFSTRRGVHGASKALGANLKSGLTRVRLFWGYGHWRDPNLTDDHIRAVCERDRIDTMNQPGRPAHWPFPTWGGA